jgi:transposase
MRRKTRDTNRKALERHGNYNLRRGPITHPLFQASDFFDSDDMIQVKYEMLRQVRVEQKSVSQVVKAFGFSRPSFYQAQEAFEQNGLSGLLPQKRGPRNGHKLTNDVVEFINQARAADASLKSEDLVEMVKNRFGVLVHRRSIERQLLRQKKRHVG